MNVDANTVWQSPRGAAKAGCLLQLTWTQREHVNKSPYYIIRPLFFLEASSLCTPDPCQVLSRSSGVEAADVVFNSTIPLMFTGSNGFGDRLTFTVSLIGGWEWWLRQKYAENSWTACCKICCSTFLWWANIRIFCTNMEASERLRL